MCSSTQNEIKLVDTYEEILRQRAELLELMEERRRQRDEQRRRQQEASQAARRRNEQLLQDLRRLEEEVRGQQLPRPHLQALESRYWAFRQTPRSFGSAPVGWKVNLQPMERKHRPAEPDRSTARLKTTGCPPGPNPERLHSQRYNDADSTA
ncbi:unnamed protein product [Tetraodon nigroviridis]|uniref:(spotted green pufferfish) hypothetical protein n=1 Tax=Tetraodon nigroviridis TaxID=99883 RepID=Q4RZ56_TETNG|nr:unnamed protein product [Tetraodon nigroviridis]